MRLLDLDASFLGNWTPTSHHQIPGIDGAQGVMFQCPKCAAASGHYVVCWFTNPINAPRVPDDAYPEPGRWQASGSGLDDLTLTPSVHLFGSSGCGWHGFVKDGDAA